MNKFFWNHDDVEFVSKKGDKMNLQKQNLITDNKITKLIPIEIKIDAQKDDRTILMIASTADEDRQKDTLNMQAWDFSDFMKNPVFLHAHNIDEQLPPIGIVKSIQVLNNKLFIKVYFPRIEELTSYIDNPDLIHDHAKFVDFIYNAYKTGLVRGVSVGFNGEYEYKDQSDLWGGGRNFKSQYLIEISCAPIPCNQNALSVLDKAYHKYLDGGKNMQTKSGKRISKKTKEILDAYNTKISEIHSGFEKACKEFHKTLKGCHDQFMKELSDEDQNENQEEIEDEEKEKSSKALLKYYDSFSKNIKE